MPASSRPSSSRPKEPLVEILSPDHQEPSEPPESPSPESPATPPRPVGLLAGVGAMLLVPMLVLVAVLAYVPRLRPWQSEMTPTSLPSGGTETTVPEGKVLLAGRVVDSEGEPVSGAHVMVYSGNRAILAGEQMSADAGAYSFSLHPGKFVVVADHNEKGMVASTEILLSEGAIMRNFVLVLAPTHVLRGKVTSAEDGTPVAGALLKIEGIPWLQRETTSTLDGTYRILRLPSYEATLQITAVGYRSTKAKLGAQSPTGEEILDWKLTKESDLEGYVLDPDRNPVRAGIVACDGKEPGQRFTTSHDGKFKLPRELSRCPLIAYHDQFSSSEPTLSEKPPIELRLRPGGGIAGLVVEESGTSVRSFFLGIESFVPALGERLSLRPPEIHTVEDTGGAFLLEKLAPGSYVLSVGADGRSPVRSPSIEVQAGQITRGIRIVLPRGGIIEGHIFDEEKKAPLVSAKISLDATSSLRREGVAPVLSDKAGAFRLEGAPTTGPFSLRIEHDGYRTRILAGLRVQSGEILREEVGLKPSGDGGTGLDFAGIGASLEQTAEGLRFREIFEKSPAEKAGVRVGDLLRRIEGQTIEGLSLADAIQQLRGEKGSQVRITVERPPSGDFVDTTITRDEIVR